MKSILILRHAKSARPAGVEDFARPLNERGYGDAPLIGKFLKQQDLVPDVVLASPAKRAKETAELVAEHSGYNGSISWREDFYLCAPNTILKALKELPRDVNRALVVAHNPTLEELTSLLAAEDSKMSIELPTAALVHIQFYSTGWEKLDEGLGVLKWVQTPKLLKNIDFK